MSKENYTFDDLDDILAEFSSKEEVRPEPVVVREHKAAAKPLSEKNAAEPQAVAPKAPKAEK